MERDEGRKRVEGLRVIFAGGGTGGHLMPGVATAEALRRVYPHSRCLFMVTRRELECDYGSALEGFDAVRVPAVRWGGLVQKLRFAAVSLAALERTMGVFGAFGPDVVVGLGGYGCVVPVLAAKALGIRTMLFESNAVAGRVVRALAPRVDCVQLQWALAAEGVEAKRFLVKGNPVRERIFRGRRERSLARFGLSDQRFTLLVLGGSQGALALNRFVLATLGRYPLPVERLQVLHLVGRRHLGEVRDFPLPRGLIYRPVGYLDEMEDAYAVADLVVARAGGSTLAELTAVGLPCVLVPYPYATDEHQKANAKVLTDAGAALCIEEAELSVELLGSVIGRLVSCPHLLRLMAERSGRLGNPEAAMAVAEDIVRLAGREAWVHVSKKRALVVGARRLTAA